MKDNRRIIRRLRIVQHCKVIDRTGLFYRIVCKRHVFGSQRFSIGKLYVIADRDCPCQTVFTDCIIRRQIISDRQIRVRHRECTLDQRLVDMLSRSPSVGRVKSRLGLRVRVHSNYDRRIFDSLLYCGLIFRCISRTARKSRHRNSCCQKQRNPPLSHLRYPPCSVLFPISPVISSSDSLSLICSLRRERICSYASP